MSYLIKNTGSERFNLIMKENEKYAHMKIFY